MQVMPIARYKKRAAKKKAARKKRAKGMSRAKAAGFKRKKRKTTPRLKRRVKKVKVARKRRAAKKKVRKKPIVKRGAKIVVRKKKRAPLIKTKRKVKRRVRVRGNRLKTSLIVLDKPLFVTPKLKPIKKVVKKRTTPRLQAKAKKKKVWREQRRLAEGRTWAESAGFRRTYQEPEIQRLIPKHLEPKRIYKTTKLWRIKAKKRRRRRA